MDNLPSWVTRVQSIWFAIGAFIVVLAGQGVNVPSFLTGIFSEAFFSAFVAALGSIISFYQVIRALFAAKADPASVQTLSGGAKTSYMLNPFKMGTF